MVLAATAARSGLATSAAYLGSGGDDEGGGGGGGWWSSAEPPSAPPAPAPPALPAALAPGGAEDELQNLLGLGVAALTVVVALLMFCIEPRLDWFDYMYREDPYAV
jgi:hypothetical protein